MVSPWRARLSFLPFFPHSSYFLFFSLIGFSGISCTRRWATNLVLLPLSITNSICLSWTKQLAQNSFIHWCTWLLSPIVSETNGSWQIIKDPHHHYWWCHHPLVRVIFWSFRCQQTPVDQRFWSIANYLIFRVIIIRINFITSFGLVFSFMFLCVTLSIWSGCQSALSLMAFWLKCCQPCCTWSNECSVSW